jgi:NitT/TauT family transport system substrate-binding protein
MGKKQPIIGLILVLIIFISASCSGVSQSPAQQPIRIEWTLWQGDYTLLVANQLGYFKKHGVNVEPVRYDSPSQAIPDLAGAKLDGGLFTMNSALLASNLVEVKGVLVTDNGGQYSLVGSPDIKNVNDLRGKRIGFNLHSSSEMFLSYMLSSERMTSKDIVVVEMSPDKVPQNIPGQADAGLVWEPYTAQALEQGNNLVYQSDFYSSLSPKLLVFSKALVDRNPDKVHAFILAWDEAVNYRFSHPQESISIISKATGLPANSLPLTSAITIYTVQENVDLFSSNPGTDPSSIYFIAGFNRDFLVTNGYLTFPIDINAFLDPSFQK